jgi:hypothetical protein
MSRSWLDDQIKKLGLGKGKFVVTGRKEDLRFALDLALFTSHKDRLSPIHLYGSRSQFKAGSDELLVLEAMCRTRFSVIEFVGRHPVAGLNFKDMIRGDDIWLVDEGLESSYSGGTCLATRLFSPEGFAMTTGAVTPYVRGLFDVVTSNSSYLMRKDVSEMCDDRHYAATVFREAIAYGLTEGIQH